MLQKFYTLKCISCKKEFDESQTVTNCLKCHSPLDVIYDYEIIKKRLNTFALENTPISSSKYLDFYPILDLNKVISLKEGGTPLYKAKNIGEDLKLKNLYIKNEGANPTGVFKDRGTLVEITKALEVGAKAVCLASSGNMAASCAAYCAVAGLPCYVLVPEGTPVGKLSQTLTYGAKVIQIRDVYSTCARLAEELAEKNNYYLAGDYVFRREGQKSQAYEIVEQLHWKTPDYLICPVGCGTNLSAIWKGFMEYHKLGLIDKLPKLIAVQPTDCSPVAQAIINKKRLKPLDKIKTICSAVAVNNPLDGNLVIQAIKKSKGTACIVSDDDALKAQQILGSRDSIFVEPSGALSLAALLKLNKEKLFTKDDVIVCLASGNGLKDPITALKNLPEPATLQPDINEINRYLSLKLYNLKSSINTQKEDKLWQKMPTKKELIIIIKKQYDVDLSKSMLDEVYEQSVNFSKKTNKMRKADLQQIIENSMQEYSLHPQILKVIDYKLSLNKHEKAKTTVILSFEDKKIEVSSNGVGPVDAVIKAIRKGIKKYDKLECWLTNFNVSVDTKGTDAVVEVKLSMKDKFDNEVAGSSISPDIILASIEAFTKGYNALYSKYKS